MLEHLPAAITTDRKGSIMTKNNVAQLEHLSQQLTQRFTRLDDLINQAWLEHELVRGALRDFFKVYYGWLGEEGVEHERH